MMAHKGAWPRFKGFALFYNFNPLFREWPTWIFSSQYYSHYQKKRLWDLIKWSPQRKCVDLLSNSPNYFFKEVYGDQFGWLTIRNAFCWPNHRRMTSTDESWGILQNVFVTYWNICIKTELHPCTVNDLLDTWDFHLKGLRGGVLNKRCLKEWGIHIHLLLISKRRMCFRRIYQESWYIAQHPVNHS